MEPPDANQDAAFILLQELLSSTDANTLRTSCDLKVFLKNLSENPRMTLFFGQLEPDRKGVTDSPPFRPEKVNKWRRILADDGLGDAIDDYFIDELIDSDRCTNLITDFEGVTEDLQLDHSLYRQQTSASFRLACVLMTVGLVVLLAGIVLAFLGLTSAQASLTICAGVVTESMAVLPFWLWRRSSSELRGTTSQLRAYRDTLQALKIAAVLPAEQRLRMFEKIILQLTRDRCASAI